MSHSNGLCPPARCSYCCSQTPTPPTIALCDDRRDRADQALAGARPVRSAPTPPSRCRICLRDRLRKWPELEWHVAVELSSESESSHYPFRESLTASVIYVSCHVAGLGDVAVYRTRSDSVA
jgi:hypothetical protein